MFDPEAVCHCGKQIEHGFTESYSISEYSLSPVVQQSTYWVDESGDIYCDLPDPEGIGENIEHSPKEYIYV